MLVIIADFVIKINFSKTDKLISQNRFINDVGNYFKRFTIDESNNKKIDLIIEVVDSPFLFSLRKSTSLIEGLAPFFRLIGTNKIITFYHLGIDLFDALIRYILTILLATNSGFLLHASAIKRDKEVYLFIGASGIGKSTILNLTKNYFVPLLDDSAILRKRDQNYALYQTPFIERNKYPLKNQGHIIRKVFILKKSLHCSLNYLTDKERILQQVLLNASVDVLPDIYKDYKKLGIKSLIEFINMCDFYIFSFNKNSKEIINLLHTLN